MRKVLVTGANGFVGANLVRVLLEHGDDVRALVRPGCDRRSLAHLPVELAEGDVRDAAAVRRAVTGCAHVHHVAADYRLWARDPGALWATNVLGTTNVLEACRALGVERVVHTSTVGTIGLSASRPADEATPLAPGRLTSPYKRSKLEAERVALSFAAEGLPVVIVNPTAPVGPWDAKPTPTGKILVDFACGRIPAFVDTGLNVVHVRDVAEGHRLAAERGRVGERYVLGHRNMTLREILAELAELLGRPAPRVRLPWAAAWIAGAVSTAIANAVTHRPPAIPLEGVRMARRRMFVDGSKAVRELGLPQTPVRTAFEDALRWYAERGYVSQLTGPRGVAWGSR
ncbi:MAG TPA: hopanoid-associated sugar epimerase [Anaeromyxobacter sp.]